MNSDQISATLARIDYHGSTDPTLETLRGLHLAHLLAVPFENLDIHIPRTITLKPDLLFDKVVVNRRGGFCYELNGLFADLLSSLGFEVSMLAARVWNGADYGVELAHMTLLVDLDQPYLADVGFGEGFRAPLHLIDGLEQPGDLGKAYRLAREADGWRYDARDPDGDWEPQYVFSTTPLALADFQPGCDYQQYSPDSHFRGGRLCSLARPDGRITLRDDRLIETRSGHKSETPIAGEAEFRTALKHHFNIDLA